MAPIDPNTMIRGVRPKSKSAKQHSINKLILELDTYVNPHLPESKQLTIIGGAWGMYNVKFMNDKYIYFKSSSLPDIALFVKGLTSMADLLMSDFTSFLVDIAPK